ncbi:endolytic transglycosylase MltG [Candidatus Deianiraea vastatrix]|uniref:Endolytic murein transglycosylase n=1 Tax=Candidatus Deianiraea vastatrix TaxID=2163644 RepID=A0A5B8XDI7_9RICK|nr:endolytic transglycosylase MltG [Candidatus Deianiraea vastatrix]QED23382.1 Putative aminodeoxychorismate lyase/endolytic murein transglycosylase [Candidatus Deianiraea vastatrix]
MLSFFIACGVVLTLPMMKFAQKDFIISVENGKNMHQIATELEKNEVITGKTLFLFANKILSIRGTLILKAGDFEIKKGMDYYDICSLLASNNYHFSTITFPEGLTAKQMIKIIEKSDLKEQISIQNIQEGSLMPETYSYTSFETKDKLIKRMQESMTDFLDKAWRENKNPMLKTKQELLILASIIEKETSVEEERPLVASVFTNRLKIGMKLQTDPTIIYEITNGETNFGRKITKADIANGKYYNTYKIFGLPKGPISCPGRSSIIAASNPPQTEFLYFVAIGDGSKAHKFAKDYKEHIKNVDEYRKNRTIKEMDFINS